MSKYIVTTILGLCLVVSGFAQSGNAPAGANPNQQRNQGGSPPAIVNVAGALGAALSRNNGNIDLAVKDLGEKLKQNPEGISDPAGKAALVKALSDIKKAGPAGSKRVLDGIFAEADKARASAGLQGSRRIPESAPTIVKVGGAIQTALRANEGKTDRVADALEKRAQQVPDPEVKAALLKTVADLRKAGPAGSKRVLDGIFAAAQKARAGARQSEGNPNSRRSTASNPQDNPNSRTATGNPNSRRGTASNPNSRTATGNPNSRRGTASNPNSRTAVGNPNQQRNQGGSPPTIVNVAGALGAALARNNGKIDLAVKDLEEKLKQNPDGISNPAGKAALIKTLSDIKEAGYDEKKVRAIFAEADKARASARQSEGNRTAVGNRTAAGNQSRRQGQSQQGSRTPPRVFVALKGVFPEDPNNPRQIDPAARDEGLPPSVILQGLMSLDEDKDGKLSPNELLLPSKPE